ncbi:transcriptional regulator, LytTR family [Sphingomonas sp. YR710]|uniref:LytTR family DNA-binding domain-containing protein n=1 Tax=Sphingomonas sp. YR710 TaxID=1882773 RepID=UPI000884BE99|nr:LytTR family DNA-binding domain-containing protein [Sphingomonas sp. YR710]SDD13611.1 transcriptional regulator, LytTR family [Sphingomonas sp. YR710]
MELDEFLRRPERWASLLGWATLAGLEFGLIGPFGSYASHLFTRIAYWTILFWAGSLLLWPSVVAALLLGPRRGFPPLFSGVVVILIACIPLAALGAAETYAFWPVHASGMRILDWYGLTIVVALPAIGGLVWLDHGKAKLIPARFRFALDSGPRSDGKIGPVPDAETNDLALPEHILSTALCLQMEDHHVRVHLQGRSFLHFAVMREVVSGLDPERGLQVHRSWWVARRAVQGWYRDDRSVTLILINGLRVPVARNRIAMIRAQGWLDGEESRPWGKPALESFRS